MQRLRFALAAAALALPALPSLAGTDVGVSIGISQPGFYGRIDVGSVGVPPMLIYPQPVVIAAPPPVVVQRPIYLHVPPGHAKHWSKHCGRYDACSRPVYFVRDDWYQRYYDGPTGKPRHKGHHHKHD